MNDPAIANPSPPKKIAWFLRPFWVWVWILSVGPLALPFLWVSPAFRKWSKISISLVLLLLTYWFVQAGFEAVSLLHDKEKLKAMLWPYLNEDQKELVTLLLDQVP